MKPKEKDISKYQIKNFNEQEFLALKRKVEAIAEFSKLLGE